METLQAIGLATPAGLNAYLTLLLVGLAGRFGWVELSGEWGERLTNPYILAGLAVLTAWEIAVDKIPGADHINDIAGSVIRPASGALVMLATPNPITDESPVAAITLGAGLAGALHVVKALLRPVVNVSTLGCGAPVISTAEDGAAVGSVAVAIVAPALVVVLLALAVGVFWWAFTRWRRMRSAARGP